MSVEKIQAYIQQNYQNAEMEGYLFCLRRKTAKVKGKRTIYTMVPDLKVDNNSIETSKYNIWTFFPKNIFVQFSKLANIYFIIIGICQILPIITTTNGQPIVYTPLFIVICISMIKDFIEDHKRRTQDELENKSKTKKLNPLTGLFEVVTWEELHIGDVIKIQEHEKFPADFLLLSTSSTNQIGICYIETKNLDGETNVKVRQSCAPHIFKNEEEVSDKNNIGRIKVSYEDPNFHMYSFSGVMIDTHNLEEESHSQLALGINNTCFRGCFLKKTHSVTGLVIYTGHDFMQSNSFRRICLVFIIFNVSYKFGTVEKQMNAMVLQVFIILIALSTFCSLYYVVWYYEKQDKLNYLHINDADLEYNPIQNFFVRIPMWILLFNTFVPISLLVTLEIVKYLQGLLLSKDKNFGCSLSEELVCVNSSNLIDQLGSVKYILSDKTGTLTSNYMRFKAISINGNVYQHTRYDDQGILQSKELIRQLNLPSQFPMQKNQRKYDFIFEYNQIEFNAFVCMNLCHQLIIEEEDGKKIHTGTSADEECIMEFCIKSGFYLESIDEFKVMTITNTFNNKQYKYKTISLHEYHSSLGKMSILVKDLQTQEYKIYQKGSSIKIFECLRADQKEMQIQTELHINQFATNILRTLCLSYRVLSDEEVEHFLSQQKAAMENQSINLQEINDVIFEDIEKEQILLGGTGVNDEFQEEVESTLRNFKKAGIKVWMITGDKRETAISIGYKCGILEQGVHLSIIDDWAQENVLQLKEHISNCLDLSKEGKLYALGVSGITLAKLSVFEDKDLYHQFLNMLGKAESIVAYHFSPKQKAELVRFVNEISPGQTVLAVGDGANDVSMIQASHVGVGIRGKEGREAAKASDFSISKFKHLNRLLLYVGQEAYRKNSHLIFFNFYKNQAWNLVYLWYNISCGMSGQYVYDQWLTQFFNLFYCSLPIIVYALFDEVHASNEFFQLTQTRKNKLESLPIDYKNFTSNLIFTNKNFWTWFLRGSYHSLILTYIAFLCVGEFSNKEGKELTIIWQGMLAFSSCVILANLKVLQLHKTHYFFTFAIGFGSIILYFGSLLIATNLTFLESEGIVDALFGSSTTYLGFLLMIITTYGFDYGFELYREITPSIQYQITNRIGIQLTTFKQEETRDGSNVLTASKDNISKKLIKDEPDSNMIYYKEYNTYSDLDGDIDQNTISKASYSSSEF